MKNITLFSIKKQKGGIAIYSADGKIEYAFLEKIKNGKVVRIFFFNDGILAEGTDYSDMKEAIIETKEKIKSLFKLKKPGK